MPKLQYLPNVQVLGFCINPSLNSAKFGMTEWPMKYYSMPNFIVIGIYSGPYGPKNGKCDQFCKNRRVLYPYLDWSGRISIFCHPVGAKNKFYRIFNFIIRWWCHLLAQRQSWRWLHNYKPSSMPCYQNLFLQYTLNMLTVKMCTQTWVILKRWQKKTQNLPSPSL